MPHTFRFEDEREIETYGFVQRTLYVDNATRPIDVDTIPRDGTEYIHLVRLIDSQIASGDTHGRYKKTYSRENRKGIQKFKKYASELQKDKETLKLKFPKSEPTPDDWDEKEWCMFCLGHELYSKIYGNEDQTSSTSVSGKSPSLSIVLHLSQPTVILLLEYILKWFNQVGMQDKIGVWVYALLACLENPHEAENEKILHQYWNTFKIHLEAVEESQGVELIVGLLEKCFV